MGFVVHTGCNAVVNQIKVPLCPSVNWTHDDATQGSAHRKSVVSDAHDGAFENESGCFGI